MIYDSQNPIHKVKAEERLKQLLSKPCKFELTEKKPKRSYNQNRYLHLVLGWFSIETGYTLDYTKRELYKKLINKETYEIEVKGRLGTVKDLRSSKDLDSKEMTLTIERFRNWSSKEAGIYLPSPDDIDFLNQVEYEIKNNKYL